LLSPDFWLKFGLMKTMLAAISATILLVSCVPSTPQARIQQSPRMFHSLNAKDRALVERGVIARGMSPDAVYIAWGTPSNTFMGSYKGKDSERWDYAAARPVYSSTFYSTFGFGGYGYGGHGRYGHHYSGIGYGVAPEISYVPTHVASVWFVNHRVDSWERAR
jgi:hypothetical protein